MSDEEVIKSKTVKSIAGDVPEVNLSEEEWKKKIGDDWKYQVLREAKTDAPSEGGYTNFNENGYYTCSACDVVIFHSTEKFQSHCGWPSFHAPVDGVGGSKVKYIEDLSIPGRPRVEIVCAKCHGHLGHVFTKEEHGTRYCVNSSSINFKKE